MAIVELSLKLVADFTTRRQTGPNQIANWTSGIETWTLGKVTERVATTPVTASIVETVYNLEITDYGRIDGTTYPDPDPNMQQTTLDANNAPAAMVGSGAVSAAWTPVAA